MITSAKIKLKTVFQRFSNSKIKDWSIVILFLGVSFYLLRVYAKGQWKYTVQFLKSLAAHLFE